MTEHELHRDVAKHLRAVLSPPVIWTTLDAGAGKMRGRTATQRKNRGVKPGWPDILIIAPGPNVLGIELKAKGGHHDANQIAVECAFHQCRAWYVLCRSVEEVQAALAYVLKVPRASEQARAA
jgi:hypothetical protein